MKDQILAVEPHDDLASLRDKILRTQAERIILIPSSPTQLRRLDLVLYARWAKSVGASICVVSPESHLTSAASRAGIPAHATLDAALSADTHSAGNPSPATRVRLAPRAERNAEDAPSLPFTAPTLAGKVATRNSDGMQRLPDQPPRGSLPIARSLSNGLFVAPVALLAVAVILVIPRADVSLALPSHITEMSIAVSRSSALTVSTLADVEADALSTAVSVLPTAHAEGELALENRSSRVVALALGTRFRDPDSGQEFETLSGAWLDPQASTIVRIRAVDAGPRGNLSAGRVREALGPARDILEVRQGLSTSGGESALRATVGPADIASLRARGQASIATKLREALEEEASAQGAILVAGSTRVVSQEESVSATAGAAVDSIHLTCTAQAEALALPKEIVFDELRNALDASVEEGLPDVKGLRAEQDSQGALRILFSVEETETPIPAGLARRLAVRTPADAQRLVAGWLPGSRATIHLEPRWWPLMPFFPFRIHISSSAPPEPRLTLLPLAEAH